MNLAILICDWKNVERHYLIGMSSFAIILEFSLVLFWLPLFPKLAFMKIATIESIYEIRHFIVVMIGVWVAFGLATYTLN